MKGNPSLAARLADISTEPPTEISELGSETGLGVTQTFLPLYLTIFSGSL